MGPIRFTVTDRPPWYHTKGDGDSFICSETQGLLDRVIQMMIEKHSILPNTAKHYQPKTVHKLVRDMVIKDAGQIKQNPSRSLLLALMDIVDIHGSAEAESMSQNDKAGKMQLQLAASDYTLYYIPNENLNCNGVKIIPVATHYSPKDLRFCDRTRSMLGTYMVNITNTTASYFMQQVLYVPGSDSLKLLKEIAGDKSEFWDMSLEVPTHPEALTPSFQQIQPGQLLRSEGGTSSEPGHLGVPSHVDQIKPMCCVFDKASTEAIHGKREGTLDCFADDHIWQDMNDFKCDRGVNRTVYFRRTDKILQGTVSNLLPVVHLRKEQIGKSTLYISTTARFCRSLKYSCLKGNSTLLECCHITLKELVSRKTFLIGPEVHQDIQKLALTAFVHRVSQKDQSSWCIYSPKYFDRSIEDPIMVEIVDLAIKLMDSEIPNAFVIAELLHCPLNKVEEYVNLYRRYSSDKAFQEQVNRTTACAMEAQMLVIWQLLVEQVKTYTDTRYGDKSTTKAQIDKLFECDFHSACTVQKAWQSLIKHETSEKVVQDNKTLCFLYRNTKVLFHNLQVYQNKLNKLTKCSKDGGESSLPSEECQMSSRRSNADSKSSGKSSKCDISPCMVIPDQPPISTWIKNMATLLLSPAWLYSDCVLRSDAVCDVLGLEKTLLHKEHNDTLHQWVQYNTTVVEQLKGLQDRLSKTLINCLDRTSINQWIPTVEQSLRNTQREDKVSGRNAKSKKTMKIGDEEYAFERHQRRKRNLQHDPEEQESIPRKHIKGSTASLSNTK